jgi:hypothetical protein
MIARMVSDMARGRGGEKTVPKSKYVAVRAPIEKWGMFPL